jgi:dynein assembly factor 3
LLLPASQVCPYDVRHTLETVCKARRHGGGSGPVHLYVHEEHAEGLARHLLLLAVLLDPELPARERSEMLLELHGNALIRDRAAEYLGERRGMGRAVAMALRPRRAAAGSPRALLPRATPQTR